MAWNKSHNPDRYYLRFADLPQSSDFPDLRHTWQERMTCNAIREFQKHHGDVPYRVDREFLMEGATPTLKITVKEVSLKNR